MAMIENDPVARRSLKSNFPQSNLIEPGDVFLAAESMTPKSLGLTVRDLDLIAGAPPCQPFSKASQWAPNGWKGVADSRSTPLKGLLGLVETFLPRSVVLENVPGFVRGRHSMLPFLRDRFTEIGNLNDVRYTLFVSVLNAADYGVPQHRERAIMVALRDSDQFQWPKAARRTVTAWDAIGALEVGTAPVMTGQWARLLPSIPEGSNYLHHTERGAGKPLFGYRTRYWSFLLKLAKDRPSWTLPAQPGPSVGPFHWDNRPLSKVEMLRLQTFPGDWIVEGNRREQVRQIGNATPPLLGESVGRSIVRSLGSPVPVRRKFFVPARTTPPPAARVTDVPSEYLSFEGKHPAHAGTGRGPKPRLANPL